MVSSSVSPTEISKQIKNLIKELPETRADAHRLDELRRIFTKLSESGDLTFGTASPENAVEAKWKKFLLKYHNLTVRQLCERVKMGRHTAIRCLWGIIAASPQKSQNNQHDFVQSDLVQQWLRAMTLQEAEEMDRSMRRMVESEFLGPFRDVQFYVLKSITALANEEYQDQGHMASSRVAEKLLELLMIVPIPQTHEDMETSQFLFPPKGDHSLESQGKADIEDDWSDNGEGEDDDHDYDDDEEGNEEPSRPKKKQKRRHLKKKTFPFQQLNMFVREYQTAWLAILQLDLPVALLKRCLSFLHHHVLDVVPEPLRFADFFIQAYTDHGSGVVGVLALDGMFVLITEHGLEYKDFYKQLYRLVSPRVLYAKYRSRFYSLLTKCLMRNEMLPAHLVAAFCKRLCRVTLNGPPSGALFVLALVSNLLRKHPECLCLVDRSLTTSGDKQKQTSSGEMEDKYLPHEQDPTKSRALQSSLWELLVLERHYLPSVATLSKSIGTTAEIKAPSYVMEDFTDHTYKSLLDQARKRRSKKVPITFSKPSALFSAEDIFDGILSVQD